MLRPPAGSETHLKKPGTGTHLKKAKSETNPKGTDVDKMPILLMLISAGFSLMMLGSLLNCVSSWPLEYTYTPWTDKVGHLGCSLVLLLCCRMIVSRNMIGAVVSLLAFLATTFVFDTGWGFRLVVVCVPLVCFQFPSSRRWLKANSRFGVLAFVFALLFVGLACASKLPFRSDKYISNIHPVLLFSPGLSSRDMPGEHVYDYWVDGILKGKCVAVYNRDHICYMMSLYVYDQLDEKDPVRYNEIVQELKDECELKYGDFIQWEVTGADTGFPHLRAKSKYGIHFEICCPDTKDNYCVLLIYDYRLDDSAQGTQSEEKQPRHEQDRPDSFGANKHML